MRFDVCYEKEASRFNGHIIWDITGECLIQAFCLSTSSRVIFVERVFLYKTACEIPFFFFINLSLNTHKVNLNSSGSVLAAATF